MNNRFSTASRAFLWLFAALLPFLSKAQSTLDSLPPIDSLSDWQVNDYARQLADQGRHFEQILLEKSRSAAGRRTELEESWNLAKADSTLSKTYLDSIAGVLRVAKNVEKSALRQHAQATKTLEMAEKTAGSDNVTQRKNLRKLWKETIQLGELVNNPAPKTAESPAEKAPAPQKREKKKKTAPEEPSIPDTAKAVADSLPPVETPQSPPPGRSQSAVVYRKYNANDDVMLHPPALPCRMAVTTRDEFSGEEYRRGVPVELFRQSPPALKNFLQGKPNIQCEAALAAAGAARQLYLTFTIHDPNPRKAFGKLDKNSPATLTFMDGSSFVIYSAQAGEGVLNPETQAFVLQTQYTLPPDVFRKMRRMELDKLRIIWSSGYEDYEVQYVRLLMDQARCFSE